jgi:2-methylcitrate dehydratase
MLNPALEIEDQSNTASLVVSVAGYAASYAIESDSVIAIARHCFIDALSHGLDALGDPACAALIGPLVPGALMPGGARVPGTSLELDPAQAAFCTGLMLCRSPGGSHWAALHGERAADPLGAILAVADYQARKATMEGKPPPKVRDVLVAFVKALEIQGVLAAEVAATAIVTAQLGGALEQIVTALSYACVDGGMSSDAEGQHDGGRDAWARANAVSRAVRHACQAMAASHASHPTSLDLRIDLAGKLLGARPSTPRKAFASTIIERLAGLRKPQELAQLAARFQATVERRFPPRQAERIKALFAAPARLDDLPVNELLAALVTNGRR